jgi:plastocyanin
MTPIRIVRVGILSSAAFTMLLVTSASTRSEREVRLRDDCDPASFNANRPGTCVINGSTTLEEFNRELAEDGEVGSWKFNPDDFHVDRGEAIVLVNRGGVTHTFTKVRQFGGGFVARLNELSRNPRPAPECATVQPDGTLVATPPNATNIVVAGQKRAAGPRLGGGVHRFQCCIHPWMRSTMEVRSR